MKINLEEKEAEFSDMVFSEALDQYDPDMLDEFISYWTEPNKSMTKVRWESEKFFHVGRRLKTWLRNQNKWSKAKNIKVNDAKVVQANFLKDRYGIS